MPAELRLEHVTKVFGGKVVAVDDFNLRVNEGEFIVLVGPSGCGKSTTMRMVAGLEDVSEGEIYIGARLVNDIDPKERDTAMVFQNYALYPHMSVFDNIGFGLKMRRIPKAEIRERVTEAARMLQIEELLDRKPAELSGGQRQRVALGRAIARTPQVFLMDEPLSNLDAKLRAQTRTQLSELHQRLQVTTVYVTHDQVEAMTLGQRIVVMDQGKIQQVGTPLEVYEHPANRFVAGFIGSPEMNFLELSLAREGDGIWLKDEGISIKAPDPLRTALEHQRGAPVIVGIRPQSMGVEGMTPTRERDNLIQGRVAVVEPLGNEQQILVRSGKHEITALVDAHAPIKLGAAITLVFDPEWLHVFDIESGEAISF